MTPDIDELTYRDGAMTCRGELYRPRHPANGHAVLVVHEADGIGGNVRRRCAMLADLGYVAAAADLHGDGRVLGPEEIGPAMAAFRAEPQRLRFRINAAFEALLHAAGRPASHCAAIGYCFGGYAALELARSGAPMAAVASFHGLLTTPCPASPGTIQARIFASTGALDPLVPPEDVATFQSEMAAARADWQLIIHGGALHSFTNIGVDGLGDPRMAYDAAADRLSWIALRDFLDTSFEMRASALR